MHHVRQKDWMPLHIAPGFSVYKWLAVPFSSPSFFLFLYLFHTCCLQNKIYLSVNIFFQRKFLLQNPAAKAPHLSLYKNIICQKNGILIHQFAGKTGSNRPLHHFHHVTFLL